ncbi:A-type flagellar hook-associated protein 2 [Pseudomonas sp. BN417]|uniref:flagellar filament capping protein FliD n=1 Tax=Pseudomonas sp. BN417 TaxID=2567890 RepID=UPI002453FBF9|nr:flagellar filament capping protein FliD [Pseudomonas sp. BN417]MDH4554446.1 A-type flagellar hook-associated protein 2 [Pseudomonas sp. BN417]
MAGITGLGSGVNIDSIVSALVNAERAPKDAQLARVEKATTTKFTALGQLKGALSEFQTALKDLNKSSLFENRSATSSDSTLLTATATKSALAGTYSIKVSQLATGSKVGTAALASDYKVPTNADADGIAGKLTVKVGASDTGTDVEIAEGATLTEVRDAINTQLKDKGVTANLLSNPSDGTTRLVLSSSKSGAGNDIQITSSDPDLSSLTIGGGTLSSADPASSGIIEAARNAKFIIDGLELESASNSVTGAIPEVTLELKAVSTDKNPSSTLTIDQDKSGVKANIKKFVDAYNKVVTTSNQLTSVVSAGDGKAPVTGGLVGDATVRTLLGGIRNTLVEPADQEGISVLADLGIATQKDGTLKIDDTKLDKALKDNFEQVAGFFTGDKGLMSRLDKQVDGYVQTGGILQQRMDGLQNTLKSVDKQKEAQELRITQLQERLYKQFNAMDSLVGQLTQTSDRLTQALASLPGVVSKD